MNSPEPTQKRLGGGMIVAAWVGFLLLLSALFGGWLDFRENPNQHVEGRMTTQGVREVELLRNPMGHYVTTGAINGQPVRFMLDTGATTVSVPAHIADELGLQAGPAGRAITANGTVVTHATRLDQVQVGNIQLHNVRADINPGMQSDEILLGMSFLKHIEFTQRGRQLILRQYP